ncbi:SGNH/GDSL hydrolase family protein [Mariniluteicoccus flavus]
MTEPIRRMASLGSSYAAGPGIEPMADRAAMRSARNYPHVLAEILGAELTDLTVSGATTATILDEPQRLARTVFRPQIEGLPRDVDLVTVTAGGNDLGYIGTAMQWAMLGRLLPRTVAERVQDRLLARRPAPDPSVPADGLARIVRAVRVRAPRARVVLVDYPPFLPPTPRRAVADLSPAAVTHLLAVADALSASYADAAEATGADLVPASALAGHEFGTADSWIMPLRLWPPSALPASFHITGEGMAAIAEVLAARVADRR